MRQITLYIVLIFILVSCGREADVVSRNISRDADSFNVVRRIMLYNGITESYILQIQGFCSLGNSDKAGELTVVCKTGPDSYKKHFLGLSDNVTFFAEQIDHSSVSDSQYKVIFRPVSIIPDVEIK